MSTGDELDSGVEVAGQIDVRHRSLLPVDDGAIHQMERGQMERGAPAKRASGIGKGEGEGCGEVERRQSAL